MQRVLRWANKKHEGGNKMLREKVKDYGGKLQGKRLGRKIKG